MIPENPAVRPDIETLSQLLARWKMLLWKYEELAKKDYGKESPQRNHMVLTLGSQLARCIDDLELVMRGDPIRAAMADSIINANKERHDS